MFCTILRKGLFVNNPLTVPRPL